jgi:hypothetical protein
MECNHVTMCHTSHQQSWKDIHYIQYKQVTISEMKPTQMNVPCMFV